MIRVLALALLLQSGCIIFDRDVSPESACINLCDCVSATPLEEDLCVEDCVANIDTSIPQECLQCVATSSCDVFEDLSTACEVECQGPAGRIVED